MVKKSAVLRAQLESTLGARIPAPFTFREHDALETVPSGVPEIDVLTALVASSGPEATAREVLTQGMDLKTKISRACTAKASKGGLPRGGLTEIIGPSSSGRTSLVLSLLVEMTTCEEVCALVDASDAFDPQSAKTAGMDLRRLLWVRCDGRRHDRPDRAGTGRVSNYDSLEQALKATDLLLAGGGFGLVVVDLGDIPPQAARRVPLAHWFRFRRAVEDTPTVLVVLEQEPYAKTCASLVLRLRTNDVYWSRTAQDQHSGFGTGDRELEIFRIPRPKPPRYVPHACLLRGARLGVEVVRSRRQHSPVHSMQTSFEVSAA